MNRCVLIGSDGSLVKVLESRDGMPAPKVSHGGRLFEKRFEHRERIETTAVYGEIKDIPLPSADVDTVPIYKPAKPKK